jgi:beta-galactosidase/beta-glucuronidase
VRSGRQPAGKQSTEYESHDVHYTRVTGIWQSVWLESVPETYVDGLDLEPDPATGAVHVEVSLEGRLQPGTIHATATLGDDVVGETSVHTDGATAAFTLEVTETERWTPEQPTLYDLAFDYRVDGQTVDAVESYVGLRSVTLGEECVYLNGEPVFHRLVLDQGYYPEGLYTAPSDDALARDIELAKAMGFNGARLHEKVFEPRFLYHADRLGYLVWVEHANWGMDHGRSENLGPLLQEWLEVVERDYNHPSVVGWTPLNETTHTTEGPQDDEIVRTVYRATKALDPARPVIDTSGFAHVETDLLDAHLYEQSADELREAIEDEPDRLSFLSEYGGIRWPTDPDDDGWGWGEVDAESDFFERYRALTETVLDDPDMWGFCYTQLYDIEQEVNGLYTYDRKQKFDPARLRAINEQEAAFERSGCGGRE